MKNPRIVIFVFLSSLLLLQGCAGGGVGVCVSSVRTFQFQSDKVYCYNNYDKAECDAYDAQNINGVDWYFYAGQTCFDRGLSEGSNNWP